MSDGYVFRCFDLTSGKVLADLPFQVDTTGLTRVLSADSESNLILDMSDGGRDGSGNLLGVSKLNPYEATQPGRTGIHALRDGVPVWGGIVWNRSYDSTNRQLTVTCATAESYYRHRFFGEGTTTASWAYTGDQFTAVLTMLANDLNVLGRSTWYQTSDGAYSFTPLRTGNGNVTDWDGSQVFVLAMPLFSLPFHIVSGAVVADRLSGVSRTFTFPPGKAIYDAVTESGGLADGFDWTLEPVIFDGTLGFYTGGPAYTAGLCGWRVRLGAPQISRSEATTGLQWQYGAVGSTVISYTLGEDARPGSNLTIATGQEVNATVLGVAFGDLGSLRAGYPMLGASVSNPDATSTDQLLTAAQQGLASTVLPVQTPQWIVRGDTWPAVGDYTIGDRAVFAVSDQLTPKQADGTFGRYSVERIVGYAIAPPQRAQIEQVTLTTNPAGPSSPRLPVALKRRLDDVDRRLRALQTGSRVAQTKTFGSVANTALVSLPIGSPGAWTDVSDVGFVRQGDYLTSYVEQHGTSSGGGGGTVSVDWRLVDAGTGAVTPATNFYNSTHATLSDLWWDQFPLSGYAYGDVVNATLQARVASFTGSVIGETAAVRYILTGLAYHD